MRGYRRRAASSLPTLISLVLLTFKKEMSEEKKGKKGLILAISCHSDGVQGTSSPSQFVGGIPKIFSRESRCEKQTKKQEQSHHDGKPSRHDTFKVSLLA